MVLFHSFEEYLWPNKEGVSLEHLVSNPGCSTMYSWKELEDESRLSSTFPKLINNCF